MAVEGPRSELDRLRLMVAERLRRGELPEVVYVDYLVQLVEMLDAVYLSLEPDERPLFYRTLEELVARYFAAYLGVPPPDVRFYEMTPREYVERVFQYAYGVLKGKVPAQSEHERRRGVELRTTLTLVKPLELMLELTAKRGKA